MPKRAAIPIPTYKRLLSFFEVVGEGATPLCVVGNMPSSFANKGLT